MTTADEVEPNGPDSDESRKANSGTEAPAGDADPDPSAPASLGAGEEGIDDLVGGLFRNVDSRFSNLQQRVQKARENLRESDVETVGHRDLAAASAAREAVATEVATLRADIERQASLLVERTRIVEDLRARLKQAEVRADLAEERLAIADERLATSDRAVEEAHAAREDLHEARRETARMQALLEARSVERDELGQVTQRLQDEKQQLELQLAAAFESVNEVDTLRSRLIEDVTQLEAARSAEAAEHHLRHEELADARAELRRLNEQVDELTAARDEANQRADRAESAVERRSREVAYLNRRIDSLTERAAESEQLESQIKGLLEQQTLATRQIADLRRELETKTAEAVASSKAVEAIAERASQHDDLVEALADLEVQLAAARAAATSSEDAASAAQRALAEAHQVPSAEVEVDGADAEPATAHVGEHDVASGVGRVEAAPPLDPDEPRVQPAPTAYVAPRLEVPDLSAFDGPDTASSPASDADLVWADDLESTGPPEPTVESTVDDREPAAQGDPGGGRGAGTDRYAAEPEPEPENGPDSVRPAAFSEATALRPVVERRRLVLPAAVQPDTPEAVEYLLGAPGVVVIVDARSFCGRTGIRPSELFDRIAALRDRFDIAIEVVVTPVSTPTGGTPELPAIGVHHVTGAGTVADQVRALCATIPADQQLVVVAGDDHVRRAATSEEANVVDPALVVGVT